MDSWQNFRAFRHYFFLIFKFWDYSLDFFAKFLQKVNDLELQALFIGSILDPDLDPDLQKWLSPEPDLPKNMWILNTGSCGSFGSYFSNRLQISQQLGY